MFLRSVIYKKMLNFRDVQNALNDNHLVDYIKHTCEHTPEISSCMTHYKINNDKYVTRILAKYSDFIEPSAVVEDTLNSIKVSLDACIRGEHVSVLTNGKFAESDAQIYPFLIKDTTLSMKANGIGMVNNKSTITLKAQLGFACNALGVTRGYVIGKDETCAMVDVENDDFHILEKCKTAASWATHVRKNHADMEMDPPSQAELYPNMRCDTDDPAIKRIKKDLAVKNKEITLVRNLNTTHRSLALSHGISTWDDPRLNSNILQIKSKGTSKIVDTILTANRKMDEVVDASRIPKKCNPGDVFVDIETLGNMHPELSDMPFMIGLGYGENSFECIVADVVSLAEERVVLAKFLARLEALGAKRILHWAPYEVKIFTKMEKRHNLSIIAKYEWIDMCAQLERSNYCPKHAFSYSLKSIAPAMHKNGMINTIWDSDCTDGLTAMFNAYNAYKSGNTAVLDDIQEYNRVDVVTTMEIWRYLVSIGIVM